MTAPPDSALKAAYGLHRAGNLAGAAQLYGEILRAEPGNSEALYLLGFVHFQRGEFADAEKLMGEALKFNPAAFDALYNRAFALMKLKRHEEAIPLFDRLIAVNPSIAEAWAGRGKALLDLGRNEAALASLDRALALDPRMAEACNNRGNALLACGRPLEALASYDRALAIRREPATLGNRANVLGDLKRHEESAAAYEEILAADPDFPYARGSLLFSRLQACDWRGLEAERSRIAAGLLGGARVAQPGSMLAISESPEEQLRCARIWAANEIPAPPAPRWRGERYGHERIRIAYLSADFCAHAVAFLIAGVLEAHDRERFEIAAISFGPDDESAIRKRIEGACERFIDARGESDSAIAQMLRRMEIDIAVDLMGYTGGCRPGILAPRPAPVQVNFLGFPGSMGAGHIDYLIADRIVIPEEARRHCSEAVVYLPDTYLPGEFMKRSGRVPPARAGAGLPETGFVFCSFNNSHKFSPPLFGVWMRLLQAIEESVLWLPEGNSASRRNLRKEAEARGVDPARLAFAPFLSGREDHLARLGLADLFLDTLPYGAHATALDALSAGVPVLTCLGPAYAGRVAASLLYAMDLPELVAHSLAEYEALALRHAREPARLSSLKAKLAKKRTTAPLFDTPRFARHLEAAYAAMRARLEREEPPASFAVERIA